MYFGGATRKAFRSDIATGVCSHPGVSPLFPEPPPVEIQGRLFDLVLVFVFMMVGVRVICCDVLFTPIDRNLVATPSIFFLMVVDEVKHFFNTAITTVFMKLLLSVGLFFFISLQL